MKIRLIWVGKTREPYAVEGIRKYSALIRPYAGLSVTEIKEEKDKDIGRMLEKEGERILKLKTSYVLLDEKGKELTSVEFASLIGSRGAGLAFVLGGAYGVSAAIRQSAQEKISLSRMTLTHEMARVLLLEQIYRGFTIIQGRGYHH